MSPRRPSSGRRELEAAIEQLEDLYAQLPALSCLGLCEASCAEHIDASTAERARLLEAGVDLDAPTPDGACPALTRTFGAGRCKRARHPTDHLPAVGRDRLDALPHGCRPQGGLVDDASALRWMIASLRIGGHDDHLDDPGLQELLELALTDQLAAGLLSRFLRGDRAVTEQLYQRMVALRA